MTVTRPSFGTQVADGVFSVFSALDCPVVGSAAGFMGAQDLLAIASASGFRAAYEIRMKVGLEHALLGSAFFEIPENLFAALTGRRTWGHALCDAVADTGINALAGSAGSSAGFYVFDLADDMFPALLRRIPLVRALPALAVGTSALCVGFLAASIASLVKAGFFASFGFVDFVGPARV